MYDVSFVPHWFIMTELHILHTLYILWQKAKKDVLLWCICIIFVWIFIIGSHHHMMTSSNRNIFLGAGPFCREFIGQQWIPLTKASDVEFWWVFLSVSWINGWVNSGEAGDLRHAHYDVIVMNDMVPTAVIFIYTKGIGSVGISNKKRLNPCTLTTVFIKYW